MQIGNFFEGGLLVIFYLFFFFEGIVFYIFGYLDYGCGDFNVVRIMGKDYIQVMGILGIDLFFCKMLCIYDCKLVVIV